jgi:hypothetical protein
VPVQARPARGVDGEAHPGPPAESVVVARHGRDDDLGLDARQSAQLLGDHLRP